MLTWRAIAAADDFGPSSRCPRGCPTFCSMMRRTDRPSNRSLNGVVQLNVTPEIEVFYMPFERSRFISTRTITSLKQNIEYFSFRCKIQLDLPVRLTSSNLPSNSDTLDTSVMAVEAPIELIELDLG